MRDCLILIHLLNMYLIETKDLFFKEIITKLLIQKNFPINNEKNSRIYGTIILNILENSISIKHENDSLKFNTPVDLNKFWNGIYNLLLNHKINLNSLEYFPLKEEIFYKKSKLKLRNTHNLIIKEIVQSQNYSIIKENLYNSIWPSDKEVQINKLDTHLTNLKNLFKDNLDYDLNFRSNSGNLTFLFN